MSGLNATVHEEINQRANRKLVGRVIDQGDDHSPVRYRPQPLGRRSRFIGGEGEREDDCLVLVSGVWLAHTNRYVNDQWRRPACCVDNPGTRATSTMNWCSFISLPW